MNYEETEVKVAVIGSGPASYMALIYAHTANMIPIFIKEETEETLNFQGYDKVVGVLNVNSQSELLKLANDQKNDFQIKTVEKKINKIFHNQSWNIQLENELIKAKTIIIDDKIIFKRLFSDSDIKELESKGVFVCGNLKEKFNEAIVLFGSGCMAYFEVKEFLSKNE